MRLSNLDYKQKINLVESKGFFKILDETRPLISCSLKNFKSYIDHGQIGRAVTELVKIPDEEKQKAVELININKANIIKSFLSMLSSNSKFLFVLKSIQSTVNDLKNFGIDWTELDIIKKSTDAEIVKKSQIDEANGVHPGNRITTMQQLNYLKKVANAVQMIPNPTTQFQRIVILNRPYDMCELNYINPALIFLIEGNKKYIIKSILQYILKRNITYWAKTIINFINHLRNIGVKWPELDTIEKSCEHEIPKQIDEAGVGKIIKGVNTTNDVHPGEIRRQSAKMGFKTTNDGIPPVASPSGKFNPIRLQKNMR